MSPSSFPNDGDSNQPRAIQTQVERHVVQIRNSSGLPIERVEVDLIEDDTGEVIHTVKAGLVKPDTTESVGLPPSAFPIVFGVRLRFVDAQGVAWERWDGTLEPQSDRSKQPSWWRSFEYEPGVIVTIWADVLDNILRVLGDVFGRVRRR